MSDVFVSYKAEDHRRVKPLVEALQADGNSVWWDEHIDTGDEWRQSIEQQLDSAKCVVVVWSKRSVGPDGHFVRDEASRAQRRHVYVPVLIDSIQPPLGFGESQGVSLKGWKGDRSDPRYQSVLGAIRRIAGDRSASAVADAAKGGGISRRAAIAGGAAVTIGVAGIGAWEILRPGAASASDSIAVLPFANLSGDPNQAYFSDGIAEEIRSALARLTGVKVVGRTSSEAVRNDDAATAAKKLDVANILSGSVRQSPSTIRVTAELVDGRTGLDKWSQDYDRSPGDAIKIQTDIAGNVARSLSTALGNVAQEAIAAGGTTNVAAHQLLLRSVQAAGGQINGPQLRQAIALASSAIELDPHYAEAFAGKAGYENLYANNVAATTSELARFRQYAWNDVQTALRLAPDLPTAHRVLASIYQFDFKVPQAIREYDRALQLAPSDSWTFVSYSYLLARVGKFTDSLDFADKAIAIDPLSPATYQARFASLMAARKYNEAFMYAQQLERTRPELFDAPDLVGTALAFLGRYSDAKTYFEQAPPTSYRRLTGEALVLARTGNRAGIAEKLAVLQKNYGDAASYQIAQMYALMGDRERAFSALDRALAIRDSGLLSIKVDEMMDPIRSDPRYRALLKTMNFPGV